MTPNVRKISIHVICCVLFLAMPYVFAPGHHQSWDAVINMFTVREFIAYVLLLVFFYLNYLVLIPRLYFSHKYLQFYTITFICFLLVAVLPNLFISGGMHCSFIPDHGPPPPPDFNNAMGDHGPGPHDPGGHRPMFTGFDLFHNLFTFLVVLFISLTLKINGRLKQTEKEKVSAELSYLKAQINPHFLFNTLNGIYSLAIENSDYTATAIVKLSGMMRYILSDAGGDFVSLDKEVNYISDYIELQKVRFDNTFQLTYDLNGHAGGKKIAPLLLLPFVENAFKHGVNPEEESIIFISIDINNSDLTLIVKNKKVNISSNDQASVGLGIENTRTRLQHLYPAKHHLNIEESSTDFTVTLTIQLA